MWTTTLFLTVVVWTLEALGLISITCKFHKTWHICLFAEVTTVQIVCKYEVQLQVRSQSLKFKILDFGHVWIQVFRQSNILI